MGTAEWTWGQALLVFAVGFGGVFVGLVLLMTSTMLYSLISRNVIKAIEKPKEEQKA